MGSRRARGDGPPEAFFNKENLRRVDLAQPETNGRAVHALAGVAGLREVAVDGALLRARADDAGRAVPLVLAALESAGARVASVTVARPSLDDVYLRHTGRTFRQAEKGEAK